MVRQPTTNGDAIGIWYNHNDLEQNLYRSLSYEETRDLGANYEKDYNAELTGVKGEDIDDYGDNWGDYSNNELLSVVPITFSEPFA